MDGAIMMLHEAMDQGHIDAAQTIGDIYCFGKGVAKDYERAMVAYKVAVEGGDALSQCQISYVYLTGLGVAVNHQQVRPWLEKAAAQDDPYAINALGAMYFQGKGVTPSWRSALALSKRAIELGYPRAVEHMQTLTVAIQEADPPHGPASGHPR